MLKKMNEKIHMIFMKAKEFAAKSAEAKTALFVICMTPIWALCYLSGEETRKRIDGKPLWFKAINYVLLLFESACLGYAGGKFFEETFQNDNNTTSSRYETDNDASSHYKLTDDETNAMYGIKLFD